MTRKLFVPAALLLCTLPILSQVQATLPTTPSDTSAPLNLGGDVLPPVLIATVEPKFKHSVFHRPKSAIVLVGLTVPVDGVPIDVHIIKSGGHYFDNSALTAVSLYHFRPATQHGKPVPVKLRIEVSFKDL